MGFEIAADQKNFYLPVRHAKRWTTLISRSTNHDNGLCVSLDSGNIVISRTTLIATFIVCALITCASVLALTFVLYRDWTRRRNKKGTDSCLVQSKYDRIESTEARPQHARNYNARLYPTHEQSNRRSESPVEIMHSQPLCEVPATPPRPLDKQKGNSQRPPVPFDHQVGLWMPKK